MAYSADDIQARFAGRRVTRGGDQCGLYFILNDRCGVLLVILLLTIRAVSMAGKSERALLVILVLDFIRAGGRQYRKGSARMMCFAKTSICEVIENQYHYGKEKAQRETNGVMVANIHPAARRYFCRFYSCICLYFRCSMHNIQYVYMSVLYLSKRPRGNNIALSLLLL